jgi:putative flippase GtrA
VLSRHVAFGYLYAAVLSNFIAISVAFLGYKWFVFKTHGNYLHEWLRCFVVYGAAALPSLLLLPVAVNALIYIYHVPPGGKAGSAAPFQLTAQYLHSTFLTAPYIGCPVRFMRCCRRKAGLAKRVHRCYQALAAKYYKFVWETAVSY